MGTDGKTFTHQRVEIQCAGKGVMFFNWRLELEPILQSHLTQE